MLDGQELRALAAWCLAHHLHWGPATGDDQRAAMLLEPAQRRGAWGRMLLAQSQDGFTLTTEAGETLASASDLPALLDALESGLGDAAAERGPAPLALVADTALTLGYVV